MKGPVNIHREDTLPMLSRIFPQLNIGAGDSGVVYQDVDRRDDSKGLANGTHHGTEVSDVRDTAEAAKLLSGGLGCRDG